MCIPTGLKWVERALLGNGRPARVQAGASELFTELTSFRPGSFSGPVSWCASARGPAPTVTPAPEGTSTLQGLTWIMCQTSWLRLFKAMPVNARKVLRIPQSVLFVCAHGLTRPRYKDQADPSSCAVYPRLSVKHLSHQWPDTAACFFRVNTVLPLPCLRSRHLVSTPVEPDRQ